MLRSNENVALLIKLKIHGHHLFIPEMGTAENRPVIICMPDYYMYAKYRINKQEIERVQLTAICIHKFA